MTASLGRLAKRGHEATRSSLERGFIVFSVFFLLCLVSVCVNGCGWGPESADFADESGLSASFSKQRPACKHALDQ